MTDRPAGGLDRRGFCGVTAAILAAASAPGAGRVRPQSRSWIPGAEALADLPRIMELASVPAVSIAVVEDGALAWHRALGVADLSTGARVTEESVFPAASLGKPVFGYAVLQLAAAGTLDLDRPLAGYFRPADLPGDPRLDRITAAHVLSHTTGLRNWRNRSDQPLEPSFEPGERFQYSGEGFYWLQQVVETVTGKGIDRLMRESSFQPAGMTRATYGWTEDARRLTVAGHFNRGTVGNHFSRTLGDKLIAAASGAKPLPDWTSADAFRALAVADSTLPVLPNFVIPNVAGSLLCTAADYGRFMALLVSGRKRNAWEIPEASRVSMLRGRVTLKAGLTWGLGVGLEDNPAGRLFWHWGDNGLFKAFMLGDPARRRAIAVFTNADSGPKVYQRLIRAATGLDPAAFLWV